MRPCTIGLCRRRAAFLVTVTVDTKRSRLKRWLAERFAVCEHHAPLYMGKHGIYQVGRIS